MIYIHAFLLYITCSARLRITQLHRHDDFDTNQETFKCKCKQVRLFFLFRLQLTTTEKPGKLAYTKLSSCASFRTIDHTFSGDLAVFSTAVKCITLSPDKLVKLSNTSLVFRPTGRSTLVVFINPQRNTMNEWCCE